MKNLVWTKGSSGLEGEFQSASEVDFYIDKVVGNFLVRYGSRRQDSQVPILFVALSLLNSPEVNLVKLTLN